MGLFNFEKLDVYQKTLDIIDEVYDLTDKFPKDEIYGLVSQLKRASTSIALNISEGSGSSDKNFNRYVGIAGNSLNECIVCLTIAKRREFITKKEDFELRKEFIVIAKMLTNLSKYLRNSSKDI